MKPNIKTFITALFCAACLASCCQMNPDSQAISSADEKQLNYQLVAHRGGIVESIFDEFDPRSIQAAIDSSYYMLEMDVRPTKDRHVILHHDNTLERIYGVDKQPEDMTLEELKQLKAIHGGYAPMTFEEACQMCKGKVRFMIDVKPSMPEVWFYAELKRIMQDNDMLASAYYIRNDVESYFGEGKYGFRITEIPTMMKRLGEGEKIANRYYLFDHGNRLNGESVKWAQQNGIEVCASVNFSHYKFESWQEGVARDMPHLRNLGVIMYQIDSDFAHYLK